MPSNRSPAQMYVRRGTQRGRSVTLTGDQVRIGASKACEIVVADAYVSDEHAVLQSNTQGEWSIARRSIQPTYVNECPVDKSALRHGDVIRIGATTELEFHTGSTRRTRRRRRAKRLGATPMWRKLGPVGCGVAIFYAALICIVVTLSGQRVTTGNAPAADVVAEVLEQTESFLKSKMSIKADSKRSEAAPEAAGKHLQMPSEVKQLLVLEHNATSAGDAIIHTEHPLIHEVLARLRQELFQGWLFENQGRVREAAEVYKRVSALIPDIRCPATRFAVRRLRLVEG